MFKILWESKFFDILIIHNLPSGNVRSQKILGPIGSAVLTIISYKQTAKQNIVLYIYIMKFNCLNI